MDTDSGSNQDTGSSSEASGTDSSGITRGAWMGSNVSQYEIDWLYRSRRIPEGVTCRLPGDEIEPVAKDRFPGIESDRRGPCRKRGLDKFDPDPVIHWRDLKMGRTPASRLGKSPPEPAASPEPQVHEHVAPLGAEAGNEFVEKLMAQGQKKRRLPLTPALPKLLPPNAPGRKSLGESKKKQPSSSPSKTTPEAPASSTPHPEALILEPTGTTQHRHWPRTSRGYPKPPPAAPKITQFLKPGASRGKAVDGSASSGSQSLVLHVGPAAAAVPEKPSGLLGRIVELKREGKDLGHLLPYAQKWNDADISASTRGLGKDRLPAPDPAGPRSTEEHFMRLKRAVKEFDSACDATSNVVKDHWSQKQLFEELLWEHRDLAEAHSHCQDTIETLKAQIATLQGEKEQLIRQHQEALSAQKTSYKELKEQAMQARLQHDQDLKRQGRSRGQAGGGCG
ncbi:hypothetical protein QYE76_036119 [Lolium multiflorum]|uniref:Uncharacterized protein n=1 Tax=Lolium multiflorum TaxID=4521 RepID=A0AAD8R245_LOLMU|nr:hypothetical protein QYE76_036119 [Lolium multiflorum]